MLTVLTVDGNTSGGDKVLKKYMKIENQIEDRDGTYDIKYLEDDLMRTYSEIRVKEKLGYVPVSVWYTVKGKWRKLLKEYSQMLEEGTWMPQKLKGYYVDPSTGKVKKRGNVPTSYRNPAVDERIYRFFGQEGWTVGNVFHDYGIEYLIAAQLGMNYKGSTVNGQLVLMNNKFLEMKKDMIPDGVKVEIFEDDVTELKGYKDNELDLIWSSPPYWNCEVYPSSHPNEMSKSKTYDDFLDLLGQGAKQIYRVLKPSRFAIIQVADFRKDGKYYNYHSDTIELFERAGFELWDIIIMVNLNPHIARSAKRAYLKKYMIKVHEYLLVFYKR